MSGRDRGSRAMRGLIVDDVLCGSPMSFNSKRVVMGKIAMIKLVHDSGKIELGVSWFVDNLLRLAL